MRVELPFLAEGVEGGDVVQIMVKEGDRVTEGQSLIELETEKATVPVPAPAAGTITRLLVRQGDHLKVGQALVELDGESGSQQAKETTEKKPTADKAPEQKSSPEQAAPTPQPSPEAEVAHAKTLEQRQKPPAQSSAPSPAAAPQRSPRRHSRLTPHNQSFHRHPSPQDPRRLQAPASPPRRPCADSHANWGWISVT